MTVVGCRDGVGNGVTESKTGGFVGIGVSFGGKPPNTGAKLGAIVSIHGMSSLLVLLLLLLLLDLLLLLEFFTQGSGLSICCGTG